MANYSLKIVRVNTKNDGLTKPKSDINTILNKNLEFNQVQQELFTTRSQKVFKASKSVNNILNKLESADTMLIHYPTDMGPLFDNLLLQKLNRKKVHIIGLIHDIDSLRFKGSFYKSLKTEIKLLNKFDCVISPNRKMTLKLNEFGLSTPVVNLQIFDYLTKNDMAQYPVHFSPKVSFTGNLNKSKFIFEVTNDIAKYNFYGPLNTDKDALGYSYKGSFESDELLKMIDSGFGLIWDGPSAQSIDTSVVSSGSYLKYNNPYKLSFYITAGVPIFIWDRAAEAEFVQQKKIGYVISSLSEIDQLMKNMTQAEYDILKKNVMNIQCQLMSGHYTIAAVNAALKKV